MLSIINTSKSISESTFKNPLLTISETFSKVKFHVVIGSSSNTGDSFIATYCPRCKSF